MSEHPNLFLKRFCISPVVRRDVLYDALEMATHIDRDSPTTSSSSQGASGAAKRKAPSTPNNGRKTPAKKTKTAPTDATSVATPTVTTSVAKRTATIRKRLYAPKHRTDKDEGEERRTDAGEGGGGDITGGEGSATSHRHLSTAAARRKLLREKMAYYQKSKTLPTSSSTLKKQIKQFYGILKDDGKLDLVQFSPPKSQTTAAAAAATVADGGKKSRGDIMITKRALELLHQTYDYYMGTVIQNAQLSLMNGSGNMTLTTDLLDLGAHFTAKRGMGPKWGMILKTDS